MLTTYTLLSFVIAVLMWTLIGRGVLRLRQRPETLVVSQPFMSLFRGM